jgi:hypothetical protein
MSIEQLMSGAIDLHVHCAPDPFTDRRVDALQLARQASEAGMKGVVIKCHQFGTAPLASIVNKANGRTVLFGSLVLNSSVGGLNPDAVEAAARGGARIIWMPTVSSIEDVKAKNEKNPGISLIDHAGKLEPELMPILAIIKKYGLILATGHISIPETYAVARCALEQKLKVIITHPIARITGTSITLEQARELAGWGAYIEFCFVASMPPMRVSPAAMAENIKAVGAEHCVLTTDLGQAYNPTPTEGFRMMLANMLRFEVSEKELESLVKVNPSKLLELS